MIVHVGMCIYMIVHVYACACAYVRCGAEKSTLNVCLKGVVDVFVVLFNCPCHEVVSQRGPKKKSFDLSHMTPWPRSYCPLLMSVLQNIFFKLKR